MRRIALAAGLVLAATGCFDQAPTSPDLATAPQFARGTSQAPLRLNILLTQPATDAVLAQLALYGTVTGQIEELNAVFLTASSGALDAIRNLPFVSAVGEDAERSAGPPLPPVAATNFANGLSTWDQDAIGVTNFGTGRAVAADGEGVYVAILDTGLLSSWPYYFPDERIAEEYARSFGGGGFQSKGNVATQPNKWQKDVQAHGSHVTSTVLGYSLDGTPINGVAPRATVIPVKVLNQSGGGWSSAIAEGIMYVAGLKMGPLAGSPMVINMSLGGPILDPVEKAAIDFAIAQGVIIVASAGNQGTAGMGFPGAYPPVISVGSVGWIDEWIPVTIPPAPPNPVIWWFARNVVDPTDPAHFYVSDFSSRAKTGQDLDVLAPGSWVVGPYQTNQGAPNYFFVGGTSMASPHVAGLVALMAQADPDLTAAEAEAVLESTAIPLPAGTRNVRPGPGAAPAPISWGDDAHGSGIVSVPAALAAVGGS